MAYSRLPVSGCSSPLGCCELTFTRLQRFLPAGEPGDVRSYRDYGEAHRPAECNTANQSDENRDVSVIDQLLAQKQGRLLLSPIWLIT